MRLLLALILILAGLGVGLYGVYTALTPVIGLYESALDDPLDEGGDDPEAKTVQRQVFRGVIIAAIGLPPLLLGTILFITARFRSRRARRMARGP